MWLEWLEDEERLLFISEQPSALDPEQLSYTLSLYASSLNDYRYYSVCRHYCKFVLRLFEL